jgi:hypothetical protein
MVFLEQEYLGLDRVRISAARPSLVQDEKAGQLPGLFIGASRKGRRASIRGASEPAIPLASLLWRRRARTRIRDGDINDRIAFVLRLIPSSAAGIVSIAGIGVRRAAARQRIISASVGPSHHAGHRSDGDPSSEWVIRPATPAIAPVIIDVDIAGIDVASVYAVAAVVDITAAGLLAWPVHAASATDAARTTRTTNTTNAAYSANASGTTGAADSADSAWTTGTTDAPDTTRTLARSIRSSSTRWTGGRTAVASAAWPAVRSAAAHSS